MTYMDTTADDPQTTITCEEIPVGMKADIPVGPNQKLVHLVRHGQATHNEYAAGKLKEGQPCPCVREMPGCPYLNPAHVDARLTQRGRLQATAAGPALLRTGPPPQLVLVSPLYRTLQTASIALSTAQGLPPRLPVLVDPAARERFGIHVCDRRSPREHVEHAFPGFDFAAVPYGPDAEFESMREGEMDVAKRGRDFLLSLRARPETCIAVFTHSSFLFRTFKYGVNCPDPAASRRFVTGEVRTFLLTYE